MRRWLAMLLMAAGCAPIPGKEAAHAPRWVAYYDKKLPASAFADYELVVFDRFYYPEFQSLKGNSTVLAYVSVGEMHDDSPHRHTLEQQDALLQSREHWGSHIVDLNNKAWRESVLEAVGDAITKGFDGVMLDTIDSPIHYAMTNSPNQVDTVKHQAIRLIRDIRTHYPSAKIMLNRGFEILPQVAGVIDFALAESILSQTDVSSGQSRLFPAHTFHLAVSKLKEAQRIAPKLTIYTLDYWNQDDVQGIGKLYAIQRSYGFRPYVTTPDLRTHTPEPKRFSRAALPPRLRIAEVAYA